MDIPPALIDQAVNLHEHIKEYTEALDTIKAQLLAAAAGQSAEFPGTNGRLAKVVQMGPSLTKVETKEQTDQARDLAGEHFKKLFIPLYAPVKSFREVAGALLGRSAPKLITLLEKPNSPRVTFTVG